MEYWILFGVFTALMLVGTPIAFCLGIASFATVVYLGRPAIVVFQQLNSGVAAFTLMAIPFFIFAGDLMMRGVLPPASSSLPARSSAMCVAGSGRSMWPPRRCSAAFPVRPWPRLRLSVAS